MAIKRKRYTVTDPNGDDHRVLARNKTLALRSFVNRCGKGKKTEARKGSEVTCGWEY